MAETMGADERDLFAEALRAATASCTGAELDAALVEIGWRDALVVDRRTAVELLFDAQGRAGATSSALGWAVADTLGPVAGSVVLPDLGSAVPPGRIDGETLGVRGIGLSLPADTEDCLVVRPEGDGFVVHTVPIEAVKVEPVGGLDPALGLVRVRADQVVPDSAEPVDWPGAVSLAHLALAHELIGASRTMLDLARTHALDRNQFGRPIARFQAVRHRLAEALVAIETADAAADGAWHDGTTFGAQVAKAMAGRSARTVVRHCQQVLAGIGFTAEHPLHTFVRRVHVLDALCGDARTLTRDLGRDLLQTRQLPPMLPL